MWSHHHPSSVFSTRLYARYGEGEGLPPVRQFNPSVSSAIERLIQCVTAFDITVRPTARELLSELDALLSGVTIAPPPVSSRLPAFSTFIGRTADLDALTHELAANHRVVITGLAGLARPRWQQRS